MNKLVITNTNQVQCLCYSGSKDVTQVYSRATTKKEKFNPTEYWIKFISLVVVEDIITSGCRMEY